MRGHRNGILSLVQLSSNEIASGSANTDRTIRIWDFVKGVCLRILKGHWHAINCLSLMTQPQHQHHHNSTGVNCHLVSAASSLNSWTKVWDLSRGECVREMRGPWYVRCMVLVPRTNVAVVSSGEKSVRVWDLKRDENLCEFEGHDSSVNALVLIAQDDISNSSSNNKKLK
jgi:WD40 repeat protein